MTSAQKSLFGLSKQTAKGTAATTGFKYLLFSRGQAGVNNMTIPLDPEVGGGAILRDVAKVGVTSGGALEFIPRPESIGYFLLGATGNVAAPATPAAPAGLTTAKEHIFTLPADQFTAPYWTVNYAPGNMWGEQYQDVRISSFGLSWRGANYVRGQVGFTGGLPKPGVATTGWGAQVDIDNLPPFITPVSTIEMPSGTSMKVLGGSFQSTMAIPLDEQWIVGSYSPDDFDIVSRAFVLQLAVKVTDASLYNKVMYDGVGAVSAWSAEILKEADFMIQFNTAQMAEATAPYSLKIEGNGGAAGAGNVVWSAEPIGLRAGSQVIMNLMGVFLADATNVIKFTLLNTKSTSY